MAATTKKKVPSRKRSREKKVESIWPDGACEKPTLIEQIIRRVRARVPILEQRFSGLADANRWDETRAQDMPFGFAVPLGTTIVENQSGGPRKTGNMIFGHSFRLTVLMCGAGDARNQQAATDVEGIRRSMLHALQGWKPTEEFMNTQFLSMGVGRQSAEYSEWFFDFQVREYWDHSCDEMGLTCEDEALLGRSKEQLELEDYISLAGRGPVDITLSTSVIAFHADDSCGSCVCGRPLIIPITERCETPCPEDLIAAE